MGKIGGIKGDSIYPRLAREIELGPGSEGIWSHRRIETEKEEILRWSRDGRGLLRSGRRAGQARKCEGKQNWKTKSAHIVKGKYAFPKRLDRHAIFGLEMLLWQPQAGDRQFAMRRAFRRFIDARMIRPPRAG